MLAEDPLGTLARLLAGVALMQGNLGHQVLGQLLVINSNEVAIAGASLVVAATTGQRSVVGHERTDRSRIAIDRLAEEILLHVERPGFEDGRRVSGQRRTDGIARRKRTDRQRIGLHHIVAGRQRAGWNGCQPAQAKQ